MTFLTVSVGEAGLGEVDPGFSPWARLIGPDGTQLSSDFGTLQATVAATAPLSGNYTILVRDGTNAGDRLGQYQISLLRLPPHLELPEADEATVLVPYSRSVRALDVADAAQQLTFELVTPPEGMTITATGLATARIDWTPSGAQGPAEHEIFVKVTEIIDATAHAFTDSYPLSVIVPGAVTLAETARTVGPVGGTTMVAVSAPSASQAWVATSSVEWLAPTDPQWAYRARGCRWKRAILSRN